jgi:hypothetical protein
VGRRAGERARSPITGSDAGGYGRLGSTLRLAKRVHLAGLSRLERDDVGVRIRINGFDLAAPADPDRTTRTAITTSTSLYRAGRGNRTCWV